MSRTHLILFESAGWRTLRPLTDILPVPALAFGASTLGERWSRATGASLWAIEARPDALAAWQGAPSSSATPDPDDRVLAVDASVLPGPWIEPLLRETTGVRVTSAGRTAAVSARVRDLGVGVGSGAAFAGLLTRLDLAEATAPVRFVDFPWQLIEWNAEAITQDLAASRGALRGQVHPLAAVLEPGAVTVESGARVDPFAVLDARGGPIWIGAGAVVQAHTLVTGPCVVGPKTQLLSGSVARSTFGPECRVAGEVEECVWQGYGNKRHHGFLGHSAIAEWVNLGALTTTSDLKNNYGQVRAWCDGREVDTGTHKLGSVIGAHVKTGIGSLLPTGCVVGVGANLFGGGRFAPKAVGAFSWWDGERTQEHRLDAFLKTARTALGRRGRSLEASEEALLRHLHGATAAEREAPAAVAARA